MFFDVTPVFLDCKVYGKNVLFGGSKGNFDTALSVSRGLVFLLSALFYGYLENYFFGEGT